MSPKLLNNMQDQTNPIEIAPAPNYERDERGLIKGVEYKFNQNGTVNWRAMIDPVHLVPNKANFKKRNQEVPDSIEGLDDSDLVVLLSGWRALSFLRGRIELLHTPIVASPEYFAVKTSIKWIPNYESHGFPVTWDALGDASITNTSGMFRYFLAAIADNRGFTRAVRSFLNVNIVGQDELGDTPKDESEGSQRSGTKSDSGTGEFLFSFLKKRKIKFAAFKNLMIKDGVEGAEDWLVPSDVPEDKVMELVEKVKAMMQD